jgi:TPR repeat protein
MSLIHCNWLWLRGLVLCAVFSAHAAETNGKAAEPSAEAKAAITLAAQAGKSFHANPTPENARELYPQWLAGQSRDAVLAAYDVVAKLGFYALTLEKCEQQQKRLSETIAANPFSLAPLTLALRCAELNGDEKQAAALERQASARLAAVFADGRGNSNIVPAQLLSPWDVSAIKELIGQDWLYGRYQIQLDWSQNLLRAVFQDPGSQRQRVYFFDCFSDAFAAGLSAGEFETPDTRLGSTHYELGLLAKSGENDAQIYLQEFVFLPDPLHTQEKRDAALKKLRDFFGKEQTAVSAAISLVMISASYPELNFLREQDLDPLLSAAEAGDANAMFTLAIAHGFKLWEGADPKAALTLLRASAARSEASRAAADFFAMGAVRKETPWFAIELLKADFDAGSPSAITMAYILATEVKTLPKNADWISALSAKLTALDALDKATRYGTLAVIGLKQNSSPHACKAATFGIAIAQFDCVRLRKYTQVKLLPGETAQAREAENLRYRIASAGIAVSLAAKDHTAYLRELADCFESTSPPQLDRAARWLNAAMIFGSAKAHAQLADLAFQGATLSDSQWQEAREQPPTGAVMTPRLKKMYSFAGAPDRAKKFAELAKECDAKDAISCELLGQALERKLTGSEAQGDALDAYQRCLKAKEMLSLTKCSQRLGQLYLYGIGVKKDLARAISLLEQQVSPSIMAINDIAWVRCTAKSAPLYAPEKATKFWPQLIGAKAPSIQDTLAACYAANGMYELASGMLENIAKDLAQELQLKKPVLGSPELQENIDKHLKEFQAGRRWVTDFESD